VKEILIRFVKKTPFYSMLRNWAVKRNWPAELAQWESNGKLAPSPHLIKQRVLREYAGKYGTRTLVETGTYFGDMVDAMRADFDRIYSIELSKDLYEKATKRFKGVSHIELVNGDSGSELKRVLSKINQPALFWLDGHYSAGVTAKGEIDTPIFSELQHIFDAPDLGHVIIVDDARNFGSDPAYPSLTELEDFIKAKRPNLEIFVQYDSIRITPGQ
jgi:hypothetical protein